MDTDVDHYGVLGLPSGEEGAKLTEKEISKAYKLKALELHPDKRPDDPNAHSNFQKLKTSYEILKDEKARKLFDDLLRVKREQQRRLSERDGKRRKMVSDLEERERAAFAPDPSVKAREEEERIARQLKEEIARIRAMHANKGVPTKPDLKKESAGVGKESMGSGGSALDKEKVLKVSWEKVGEDYSAEKLRELFSKFGEVEDVVIKGSKKKGSALVVMATKEGAVSFFSFPSISRVFFIWDFLIINYLYWVLFCLGCCNRKCQWSSFQSIVGFTASTCCGVRVFKCSETRGTR